MSIFDANTEGLDNQFIKHDPNMLQQLIGIAAKYQVLVSSDEIHSDIVFSGHTFNSLMSFDYENF